MIYCIISGKETIVQMQIQRILVGAKPSAENSHRAIHRFPRAYSQCFANMGFAMGFK